MILPLLLMIQVVPAPGAADDIVVIGQRLEKKWAAKFRFDEKGMRCQVTRSTGDAAIDRVGCAAMEACLPTFQSRYTATDDRAIRPEVKNVMRSALNQELTTCVKRERQAGISALVARRKGA